MTEELERRDFIKTVGLVATAAAAASTLGQLGASAARKAVWSQAHGL